MTLDPQSLSNIIMGAAAWGAAFLVALWLSLIIWTYRDMRSRASDPLLRILATLIVALLFLPGIAVYLIIRPPRSLEDEYQRTLEEEALLQSIEDIPLCPGCGRRTEADWLACPSCHTRLKKPCHHCGKLMELSWNLCPYCSTPAQGMRKENITINKVTQLPPDEEGTPPEETEVFEEPLEESLLEERLKDNGAR
jgi:RNA polymerase subunit RPABC4/transcription elongation factor Spt4